MSGKVPACSPEKDMPGECEPSVTAPARRGASYHSRHDATPLDPASFDPHASSSERPRPPGQSRAPQAKPDAGYFPAPGGWEKREPATIGLDKAKIDEAIALSIKNENQRTKNLAEDIPATFRNEAPYNTVDGPTQERTGMNGVIIYKGYAVAEWGDTNRADMTFSVTKSFLSTVVGLAYDRKLIKDVNDRVAPYMPKGVDLFTSEHNAPITWDHLLRQTSDWYGELWGKPDWADRPGENGATPADWPKRPRRAPGTFYQVQRCPRERAVARDAVRDEEAAAGRAQGIDHGSDRRVEHLALGACTTTRTSRSMARRCRRSRVVVTTAAACSSAPGTWPGSDTCSCGTATGTASSSISEKWIEHGADSGDGVECGQQDLRLHELVPERA